MWIIYLFVTQTMPPVTDGQYDDFILIPGDGNSFLSVLLITLANLFRVEGSTT